jgi:hypothetical protein
LDASLEGAFLHPQFHSSANVPRRNRPAHQWGGDYPDPFRREDKIRGQDLENLLVEQSRLLGESDFKLKRLRSEIEIARKAEGDCRQPVQTSRCGRK